MVYSDVWITTGGTMNNALTEHIGKAVHETRTTGKQPILMGFTKLWNVRKRRELTQQSFDVINADHEITHEEVLCRLLLAVHPSIE